MQTTDQQVRRLWMERQKNKTIVQAALKAGLTRKTASKYIKAGELPSEIRTDRDWKTREDPFDEIWEPLIVPRLQEAPELQAKALFEWLLEQRPDLFREGQLRTFQRKVRQWRAADGPPKEVFFPQVHLPGKRMSTDFTHMDELEITIAREPFPHLLCHCVLSFSNWEWATICHSESLLALRGGIQSALLQAGHIPTEHWTDHSTAATHQVGKDLPLERAFNEPYLDMMRYFGMTPQTIQVNKPHENGDVEAANGALKNRLKQHLLLRGSRDFESRDTYRLFLEGVVTKANRTRAERFKQELTVMRPLAEQNRDNAS